MNFADSFNSGFNSGIQLGARAAERKQEQARWDEERQLRKSSSERLDAQERRAATEFDAKEAVRKAKALHAAGSVLAGQGDFQGAASMAEKLYEFYPDGMAAKVIDIEDPSLDPSLKAIMAKDPNMAGKKTMVVATDKSTGKQRISGTFKDINALYSFLSPHLDPETFQGARKQAEQSLATAKASAKPMQTAKGWVIDDFELTPDGVVRKTGQVPYVGETPIGEIDKKIADAKRVLGKSYDDATARAILGVPDKTSDTVVIPEGGTLVNKKSGLVVAKGTPKAGKATSPAAVEAYYDKLKKEWTDEFGEPLPEKKNFLANWDVYRAQDIDAVVRGYEPKNIANIAQSLSVSGGKKAAKKTADTGKGGWRQFDTPVQINAPSGAMDIQSPAETESPQSTDTHTERVPGYSPRQWAAMNDQQKQAARDKYISDRKRTSRQGLVE